MSLDADDITLSPEAERAADDAISVGAALLKYISRNDVGATGGHQCGYYLPKAAARHFTPHPPERGKNSEHPIEVTWQDGRVTQSCVHWYGQGTRSEYRLTRFGRDFPWLSDECVGDLLILVPVSHDKCRGYVLDTPLDVAEVQAILGVEIIGSWTWYNPREPLPEDEDACVGRTFREFVASLEAFPPTADFSRFVRETVSRCAPAFDGNSVDVRLMRWLQEEYTLFKLAERALSASDVTRVFRDVDDFLSVAASIMNRRKSRAGRSLENHFEELLKEARIPFECRPVVDNTRPDVLIPGKAAYDNRGYPVDKLLTMGLKTTCKDRWRQVLSEAPRARNRFILTLQAGISENQLREMGESGLSLVVPEELRGNYPREPAVGIYSVAQFLSRAQNILL